MKKIYIEVIAYPIIQAGQKPEKVLSTTSWSIYTTPFQAFGPYVGFVRRIAVFLYYITGYNYVLTSSHGLCCLILTEWASAHREIIIVITVIFIL